MTDISRLAGPSLDYWEWQMHAACGGMDSATFFHAPAEHRTSRERHTTAAKEVCGGCPVITECREHALRAREPYGIWGGLTESERAKLLGLRSLRFPAQRTTTTAAS